jgi:hypothetical protein
MSNNKQNYVVIDENPFNYLSNNYNSLQPPNDFYRDGAFSVSKVSSVLNPPLDYQNKLVANNYPYHGNDYFHKEYPELTNTTLPRTNSASYYSKETMKDVNTTTMQNNINAGIPPVQVNPDINTSEFQSSKIPTEHSMWNRRRGGCMDYISHCKRCPACARYFSYERNMYIMIMIMILIVSGVIIWFLTKDIKALKKLAKSAE